MLNHFESQRSSIRDFGKEFLSRLDGEVPLVLDFEMDSPMRWIDEIESVPGCLPP